VGRVLVVVSAVGVRKVWFEKDVRGEAVGVGGEHGSGAEGGAAGGAWEGATSAGAAGMLSRAVGELTRYFAGSLRAFTVPVDWDGIGGTRFQRAVWDRLVAIPLGGTVTYGQIARDLPAELGVGIGASRAVGLANHDNPVAIIVPCHRVVGSDGTLTGYAGGLGVKRWLLDHEARVAGTVLFA
jgi:methylated-DNA-[protein]-cysteine S-methyltransferase